jgi:predicted RNA binding protein YcfA (HicA-like mRNA interferase family)
VKYRDFVAILTGHGFECIRTKGSHRQYQGFVDGQRKLVTVDYSQAGEDIRTKNLKSMIRQSGLPRSLFP